MSRMRLCGVTAAEIVKLRTLPIAVLTALGTPLAAAVMAVMLAAHLTALGAPVSGTRVTLQAIPFVQTGLVLLGVLPVVHEHAGRQLYTTLTVVPHRGVLLAAKSLAALGSLASTSVVTVGAMVAAAMAARQLLGTPSIGEDPGVLLGAVGYLVLVGAFSHAVALLVRHLVPALAGMLSLLLIVSPLLAGLTEHARWLPDRAAMQLYDPSDAVLTATAGALVAVAWTVLVGGVAAVLFVRRDP